MNLFKEELEKNIQVHLESSKHRYTNNSLGFYKTGNAEYVQADTDWFKKKGLPTYNNFMTGNNLKAVRLEIQNKGALYERLEDMHSRAMLLVGSLYNLLGHRLVKFPMYNDDNAFEKRHSLHEQYNIPEERQDISRALAQDAYFAGQVLHKYKYPISDTEITMYTSSEFLYRLQAFHTGSYYSGERVIDVEDGDWVLNCGACRGDLSLIYAAKVGLAGQVISFEPNQRLEKLCKLNMAVNPKLAKRMQVFANATGINSYTELVMCLKDPSANGMQPDPKYNYTVNTVALDDLQEEQNWPKIDFIRLDVDGAEFATLHGAEKLIRRFKPKLAICLSHHIKDYMVIPQWLNRLGLGYQFFLEQHFINNRETFLYATTRDRSWSKKN